MQKGRGISSTVTLYCRFRSGLQGNQAHSGEKVCSPARIRGERDGVPKPFTRHMWNLSFVLSSITLICSVRTRYALIWQFFLFWVACKPRNAVWPAEATLERVRGSGVNDRCIRGTP